MNDDTKPLGEFSQPAWKYYESFVRKPEVYEAPFVITNPAGMYKWEDYTEEERELFGAALWDAYETGPAPWELEECDHCKEDHDTEQCPFIEAAEELNREILTNFSFSSSPLISNLAGMDDDNRPLCDFPPPTHGGLRTSLDMIMTDDDTKLLCEFPPFYQSNQELRMAEDEERGKRLDALIAIVANLAQKSEPVEERLETVSLEGQDEQMMECLSSSEEEEDYCQKSKGESHDYSTLVEDEQVDEQVQEDSTMGIIDEILMVMTSDDPFRSLQETKFLRKFLKDHYKVESFNSISLNEAKENCMEDAYILEQNTLPSWKFNKKELRWKKPSFKPPWWKVQKRRKAQSKRVWILRYPP